MFEQAVIRAIKARDAAANEDGKTLREIAENLLDMAGKELAAMVQLRDTLDGKPAQAIALSGDVNIGKAAELTDDQLADIANGSGPAQA